MSLIKRALSYKLTRDVFYVGLAQVAMLISVFGVNKVVSIYTGVAGFALFSLIKRAGGVLSSVLTGGMTIALPRYVARQGGTSSKMRQLLLCSALFVICLYAIPCICCMLIAPEELGRLLFGEDGVGELPLLTLCVTFLFAVAQAISNTLFSYYQGVGDFRKYNSSQILCSTICLVMTLLFRKDVYGVVLASYLSVLLYSVVKVRQLLNDIGWIRHKIYALRCAIKKLFLYGFSRMLHDVILYLQDVIPLTIILSRFDLKSVGIYSAGLALPLTIAPLFAFTGGVFLQRVSKLSKGGQWSKIRLIMRIATILFLILSAVGAALIIAFDRSLIRILFSDDFLEVTGLTIFFALSLIPRAIYLLYRNPLDAVSEKPYNLIIVSARTMILVGGLLTASSVYECAKWYLYSSITMAVLPIVFWSLLIHNLHKKYVSSEI